MTDAPKETRFLTCDAIRELTCAYMSRELGEAPSRAVREHLRTCESCRREAAEIAAALTLLKAAKSPESENRTLSDRHHRRLARAVMHPVREWMYVHHRGIALLATVLVLGLVLFLVRGAALLQPEPEIERIPIWRYFKSGDLPTLVEEELERLRRNGATPDNRGPMQAPGIPIAWPLLRSCIAR